MAEKIFPKDYQQKTDPMVSEDVVLLSDSEDLGKIKRVKQGQFKGEKGAQVVSTDFVGNDIVFTLTDGTTATLVGGKTALTGPQGDKGNKGDTGAKIVSSAFSGNDIVFTLDDSSTTTLANAKLELKGEQGIQGIQGPQGEPGPIGNTGPQGPQGEPGPTGATGAKGDKGETGDKGDKGETGNTGPQGPIGNTGPQGPQGNQGVQGNIGPKVNGVDWDGNDMEFTNEDNSTFKLANAKLELKGETGDQGPQGIQGPQGPAGEGSGDMLASVYDPTNVAGDAFDFDNFYNTPTASDYDIANLSDAGGLRSSWTGKQDKLTAGSNVDITNNVVSSTNTTYQSSDFDIKDLTDSTNLRTTWSGKEDSFSKNTAFNKNFGTTAGTVMEGNTDVGKVGTKTVDETGLATGKFLKYDGTKWIADNAGGGSEHYHTTTLNPTAGVYTRPGDMEKNIGDMPIPDGLHMIILVRGGKTYIGPAIDVVQEAIYLIEEDGGTIAVADIDGTGVTITGATESIEIGYRDVDPAILGIVRPGASGDMSTSSGHGSTASGAMSTASGAGSTASDTMSTASGAGSTASGFGSTASGTMSTASGTYSTASGTGSTASGYLSTASGYLSTASGAGSTASGAGSTALYQLEENIGLYSFGGLEILGTSVTGVYGLIIPANNTTSVTLTGSNFRVENGEGIGVDVATWNNSHILGKPKELTVKLKVPTDAGFTAKADTAGGDIKYATNTPQTRRLSGVSDPILSTDAVNKRQLDTKQATLVNQTNIKSINGQSILGSGDLSVGDPDAVTSKTAGEPTGSLKIGNMVAIPKTDYDTAETNEELLEDTFYFVIED